MERDESEGGTGYVLLSGLFFLGSKRSSLPCSGLTNRHVPDAVVFFTLRRLSLATPRPIIRVEIDIPWLTREVELDQI